jgi:thiazolinyl imide reductase
MPFELAGILARGGARSRACAEHYGVPLYTDVDQLPATIDMAAVVVSAGINGGPGTELAQRLMSRGVHVLQEHPLHHDELAGCLRQARRHRVVYHVNSHYVYLDPVRRFIEAARQLLRDQPALFVDAVTSFQVLYTLFDILYEVLGGVRPWSFATAPPASGPLRTLDGMLAGVPVTLRVQNDLDPVERDNGGHIAHRITLGVDAGNLLLANTNGPVLWSPRLHMPADYPDVVTVADSAATHLDLPSVAVLGPPDAPSHRQTIADSWPRATARALLGLREAVLAGADPLPPGQRHLALCRLTADATAQLGPPTLRRAAAPRIGGAAVFEVREPVDAHAFREAGT